MTCEFDCRWNVMSFRKGLYSLLHQATQPVKMSHSYNSRGTSWVTLCATMNHLENNVMGTCIWNTQPLAGYFHEQALPSIASTGNTDHRNQWRAWYTSEVSKLLGPRTINLEQSPSFDILHPRWHGLDRLTEMARLKAVPGSSLI